MKQDKLSLVVLFLYTYGIYIFIAAIVALQTFIYRSEIFAISDEKVLGQAYAGSQYVMGESAISKIDDSAVYSYAATQYIKGQDPTTINFEHPPLGKYIFGLSVLATQRVLVINILLFSLILIGVAILQKHFKFPNYYLYLTVCYLGLFSGMPHHLRTALLDYQVLVASLFFFIVLFGKNENWRKYILLGLLLGLLLSIKYFFPLMALYYLSLIMWAFRRSLWKKVTSAVALSFVFYLFAYAGYFLHGHSLIDWLRFEWYRFKWWTGNRNTMQPLILEILFTGYFSAWWSSNPGEKIRDMDWNFSWPLLFVGGAVSSFFQRFTRENYILLFYIWSMFVVYIISSAPYGRYLFQLMPFMFILIGNALYYPRKSVVHVSKK